MLAGMDLPRPKDAASLRMRAAQLTLRRMRMQGHDYLDLRQDGKRIIYLCIICLKPCYSEPILFQHLKGNGHKKMLRIAELTMRLENPWPFNDGMVFFNPARDELCSGVSFIDASDSSNNAGALIKYNGKVAMKSECSTASDSGDIVSDDIVGEEIMTRSDDDPDLIVPNVLWKGGVCNIELKYLGLATIGARLYKEKGKDSDKIRRICCQWMGETVDDEDISSLPQHDFAVVSLRYALEISMGWEDETEETEYESSKKKKRRSFSDPEDSSISLINYHTPSLEDSTGAKRVKNSATSRLHLSRNSMLPRVNIPSDELLSTGSATNSELRREIRKRQRLAVTRMCLICQHKMQPGKDVAALLNLKTGKLACSSRNLNGAFHVFHVSCLLHWILLCEYEAFNNPVESQKWKHTAKKKKTTKMSHATAMAQHSDNNIHGVICPACQGTGKHIKGARIEKYPITPSQMFRYTIQTFDGRREWRKDPEILPSCSIGLHYPPESEEIIEELTATLKLLRFYTVDDPRGELAVAQ